MNESDLRERLRATRAASDPELEERAWRVVRSAYRPAEARRRRRRCRLTVPAVACLVAIAAIVLTTASAPREALARWLRQAIGLSAQPQPRPMLAGLPGGGQLLVNSPSGPWIVRADGRRDYLGRYSAAAWSPHSLYVVAWRGAQLSVLDPRGRVQWTLGGDGRVAAARWSPDGYRIAYLAGRSLRIVAGDGSDEHQLSGDVAPVTPAWQAHTGQAHRLAFLDRLGDVELRDADTGALLWRAKSLSPPQQLLWSPDGTSLLLVAAHRLSVYDVRGRLIATRRVAFGETVGAAAYATGDRVAVVLRRADQPANSVVLLDATRRGLRRAPQTLFTAPERLSGLSWSPNDQWLLTSSPSADQWIFIGAAAPTRLAAVSRIARQFQPKGERTPGFPTLGGWQP